MTPGTQVDVDDDALDRPLGELHADLPADPRSAAVARRLVTAWCEGHDVPAGTTADVELIVSEFVTNAVVHGRGTVRLRVQRSMEHVVVTVVDGSGAQVARPVKLVDPGSMSGRGLWIAGVLSAHQGSYPAEDGTAVWALVAEREREAEREPEADGVSVPPDPRLLSDNT